MKKIPIFFFHCLLLLLFWVHCLSVIAQVAPKLTFKRIGNDQGLSNNTIESIFQDSRGFIWFGTRDGLNRYDGYKIEVYRYDPKDTNSISDNYIRCMVEDKSHNLWIGTINGLNRFNVAQNNFTRFKHNPANGASISNNLVTCVYEDKQSNLWVGTFGGGLNLFKPSDHTFLHFRQSGDKKSISSDEVNDINEDEAGNCWVATENGLNLFDRSKSTFMPLFNSVGQSNFKENNMVRIAKPDGKGNVWLGTEDNGLFVMDVKTKTFKPYQHIEKEPNSLSSNQVRSILFDKNNRVWIGTVNGGLNLFQPTTNNFTIYQNEADNPRSLSQRTVSALFEDNQGNLWVGTHRGGVNVYMPGIEKFKLYQQQADVNSLSYNDVKSFCEDSKGNIWIGTDGGGLNIFDRGKNTFRHFKYDAFNTNTIGSNEVLDITEDRQGNIWIGTWGGGLNLYHPTNGTFERFTNNTANKNSITSNYIQEVFEDASDNLWIATYYGGLNLYNRKTGQFARITDSPDKRSHLQGNNIISIEQDKAGNIWFGTDDGGLNCYDTAAKQFAHYFDKDEKLPDLRILFVDSKGRLWVGQSGLYLFDPIKKQFALFTDKAGLGNEFIKGMAEDENGLLWITTASGLVHLNTATKAFKKYNRGDGLQGLEFEANAYLKTRDGELYFGGVNGFNRFYPKDIRPNTFVPPVYITGFEIFNKAILPATKGSPLQEDISVTKEIKLSYDQSSFSFSFAGLNFTASQNNKYAYKLEGLDKDWIDAGKEQKASYTNIDPGDYTFRVKASNNDGVWNNVGAAIKIKISPPFWKSWWFVLLMLTLVLYGVYIMLRNKRRSEIKALNEKKREEIHQMKLQFFTNISHELRTPLTLILSPLEKMLKEDGHGVYARYYQLMQKNAYRLLNLVNELMDFRKVESGVLQLKVMPGNIGVFLKEISEEFYEFAAQKKMIFTTGIAAQNEEVLFDHQVLEKIVLNLLNNSFKYTPEGGTVTLELLPSLENFKPAFANEFIIKSDYSALHYAYVRVADNGIGISKESIPNLFERYFRVNDSHLGSGIGLAFVKSLTLLHKGKIFVYSEREKGTEIIVAIPTNKNDYSKEETWLKGSGTRSRQLESIALKYQLDLPVEEEVGHEETTTSTNLQTILVVDDNDELRNFLKESLAEKYHIIEAANGSAGLEKAKQELPDLIVSDVMMPIMDGNAFCKLIKEDVETSHIPFIMLTAKTALASNIEGVEAGADFYFGKPLSMELLQLTIRNLFEQKRKQKERFTKSYYAEAKELVTSAKDKAFMEQLVEIIESQLINPELDVELVCNSMGMSRTKLYQKIKSITGLAIGDFIRTIRLKRAAYIITHEDVQLSEVIFRIGIQTQSYFTKAFKKEFGKTPTQFMQELKK